jgi:hypothetical protein
VGGGVGGDVANGSASPLNSNWKRDRRCTHGKRPLLDFDLGQETFDRDEGVRGGHRFLRSMTCAIEVGRDGHGRQGPHGRRAAKSRILDCRHLERAGALLAAMQGPEMEGSNRLPWEPAAAVRSAVSQHREKGNRSTNPDNAPAYIEI